MGYNSLVFLEHCLLHVYNFVSDQTSNKGTNLTERVSAMVKRQVKLFPTSNKLNDYRQLFDETTNKSELEKYFDAELLEFLNDITLSGRIVERRKKH